ncbi:MAG: hypothetical protein H7Y03_07660 [Chitinophagaceae bacterium]|nr:hypothetical protein [Chitinophagaceae bacterium]
MKASYLWILLMLLAGALNCRQATAFQIFKKAEYLRPMPDSVRLKPGGKGMPSGVFRNHIGLNEGKKWSKATISECARIGIKILRKDLEWDQVERQKAVYDWAEIDEYLSECKLAGIKVILILGKVNKLYDSTATIPIPGNFLWEAYSNYVKASLRRYKKSDVMWELCTEPDIPHMYADMTPVQFIRNALGVMELIRSIDPEATIAGPGSGFPLTWENESWNRKVWENLLRQNKTNLFIKNLNVWTGHFYINKAPDNVYTEGVESYDLQRMLLNHFNAHHIPYATGERGFTANPKESQAYAFSGNEYLRISYYLRQCLWGMYKEPHGFVINYVTTDIYNSGKDILYNPAGEAIKLMLDNVGDFHLEARISFHDEGIVLLKFIKGDKEKFVAWDRFNRSLHLNLPIKSKRTEITNYQGKVTRINKDADYLESIEIGSMPIFIHPNSD